MNTDCFQAHTVQTGKASVRDCVIATGDRNLDRLYCSVNPQAEEPRLDCSKVAEVILGQNGQRFVLGEVLGRGGLAVVRRACRLSDGKIVALKLVSGCITSEKLDLLRRESRVLSVLDHPNIVQVVEWGETRDRIPYLAMECLEGQSLETLLKKEGKLPVKRAADICLQIAQSLEHAHRRGVVHNDLKPANVMICNRDGRDHVYVIDFGIASTTPERHQQEEPVFGGTLSYLSPEQKNVLPTTPRSDVYQLGLIFFLCLFGKLPCEVSFEDDNSCALTGCRQAVIAFLWRVLAEDPLKRIPTMHVFKRELEKALNEPHLSLALASACTFVSTRLSNKAARKNVLPASTSAEERKTASLPIECDVDGVQFRGYVRALAAA